jgi:hypothetical protein
LPLLSGSPGRFCRSRRAVTRIAPLFTLPKDAGGANGAAEKNWVTEYPASSSGWERSSVILSGRERGALIVRDVSPAARTFGRRSCVRR